MRSGATIVAVVPEKDEVHVTYMQGAELKTVAAKAVIMATPKFITRRLVDGLPEKQSEPCTRFATFLMRWSISSSTNRYSTRAMTLGARAIAFTDFVVADWVVRKRPGYKQKYNILTCYTPLREEERGLLLTESSARTVRTPTCYTISRTCSPVRMSIR